MSTCLWLQKIYKIPRWAYPSVVRTEFLLCETKLMIDTTEMSRSVWTLAELAMVTKGCDCMLTVFAGEHPSYWWILYEALSQTSLLFSNIPVREQNQFLFHHCMDQLKTELLPSWLREIIFLCAFPSFLHSGRKHETMELDRIPLQGTCVPQWLIWYYKKIHTAVYITCVCWVDISLWKACVCKKKSVCSVLEQSE